MLRCFSPGQWRSLTNCIGFRRIRMEQLGRCLPSFNLLFRFIVKLIRACSSFGTVENNAYIYPFWHPVIKAWLGSDVSLAEWSGCMDLPIGKSCFSSKGRMHGFSVLWVLGNILRSNRYCGPADKTGFLCGTFTGIPFSRLSIRNVIKHIFITSKLVNKINI